VSPPGLHDLVAAERQGVLATISARLAGWPFASVAPYATTPQGEPLLLLSDLAEHTRNLRADPRASLLVQDSHAGEDPQAAARVTLLGTAEVAEDLAEAQERYTAQHPQATQYLELKDFHLWVLRIREARFVNGFGDMGWLEGNRLRAALAE
jgi:heme oxygenase (biliverdin-IX-beta and delta-forming)